MVDARGAEQGASRSEAARALHAAIERLTPGQRVVAFLHAAGHAAPAIERILGRSRWSVRSALAALRGQLATRLRAVELEALSPVEPLVPTGFFAGRRGCWKRPWSLHLAGASSPDIAQALRVPKPAAKKRIQRIRRAILAASGIGRSMPRSG